MEQMKLNPNNLTRVQLEAGLDQLKKWYPEDAAEIESSKEVILAYIVDGVQVPEDHPLKTERFPAEPTEISDQLTLSPCGTQLVGFGAEAGVFIATVAGAWTASRFTNLIERKLPKIFETEKYVKGITPLLKVLNEAEGNVGKAKAFAPIAKKLWDIGVIAVVFDVIKQNSTKWDWLIDGAIALGQLIVWVASEFIAAIAEIAVVILSAVHLLLTSVESWKVCRA